MVWLGSVLLPHHIGTFFETGDFSAVKDHFHLWIWMYRVHFFGLLLTVMAFVAFGSLLTEKDARVVLWPGIGVAATGIIVGTVGETFYYHHGAWGALELAGQSEEVLGNRVDALLLDTEYITCLVRFGRVFYGLGQIVLALGLLKWRVLPSAIGGGALFLGAGAMILTMAFPDNLEFYGPLFHLNAAWSAGIGIALLRSGVKTAG